MAIEQKKKQHIELNQYVILVYVIELAYGAENAWKTNIRDGEE